MNYSMIKIWIDAARPKTLWAAIAPVIIGTAMAYSEEQFHLLAAVATLLAAILIQIGTNYANDYFDFSHGADNEKRLGPIRATSSGLVKPHQMKFAFVLIFFIAFMIGIYLIWRSGWPILIIGILSILFGLLYTSGPYPLGYTGIADIFVIVFFGPVAVGGTYYIQSLNITSSVLLAGLSPGLISTAILTVNNLRDIKSDAESGKKTLAVRFGSQFAKLEYLLMILIACLIPLIIFMFNPIHPYSVLSILVIIFALPAIKKVFNCKVLSELNHTLAYTGRILFLYSLIFSIGWII